MELKDFFDKTYSEINDNIKFAEAKNAALITLNSALIAACADKIFDYDIRLCWRILVSFLVISLMLPLIISIFSFRATTGSESCLVKKIYKVLNKMNTIDRNRESYMYYAYIAKFFDQSTDEYLKKLKEKIGTSGADEKGLDLLAKQIVDLSNVAYRKFTLFNIAIKIECSSFVIGTIIAIILLVSKIF